MQALVTEPAVPHSTRVEDIPEPSGDGVLLRVLEVGVCGTDREISEGLFGVPADGKALVLGHESLATVERDGYGFSKGDLVTATVRRSCHHCIACEEGAPDSCLTGDYSERGITRLDGFARELVIEDPTQLIPIPAGLGRLGVLAEPTSICERSIRHALTIGGRQPWQLERALVVGAGAIGMISTYLLRLAGLDVWTASLDPSSELVTASGAHYVSTKETSLGELRKETGGFDLVVSCVPDAQVMADSLALLRRSGVACLLGIDGREQKVSIDGPVIGLDAVLENRVLFGSVNAHHQDWLAAVESLDAARKRWPEQLEAFIGRRVPLDRFQEAFDYRGVKATLVLDDA
jgi:threonine dehydrogenase-like Zn-dependent dehydrogenase